MIFFIGKIEVQEVSGRTAPSRYRYNIIFFRYDKNGLAIKMNSFNSQKQKINPLQFKIQKQGRQKGMKFGGDKV